MRVLAKSCSTLIVLSAAFIVAFSCAPPAYGGDEVFRIDGRTYTAQELCGSTLVELRKQFDDEVRDFSDDRVRLLLQRLQPIQPDPEVKGKPQDRASLNEALWNDALGKFLEYAAGRVVHARITDRIAARHGIELETYYNFPALRDAIQRELQYIDFSWKHRDDPPAGDDALYDEAVKEFRLKIDKKFFRLIQDDIRQRPAFTRWNLAAFRRFEDEAVKAMLANYLLQQACEEGIYNERGRELCQYHNLWFYALEVSGYRGSKAALEAFLSNALDKDGAFSRRGVKELKEWLRVGAPASSLKLDMIPGSSLLDGLSIPTLGALYEPKPNTYRAYLRVSGPVAVTGDVDAFTKIAAKNYGYQLAVAEYSPTIESFVKEWKPKLELLTMGISVPGVALMTPEVEVDPFVNQDYPGDAFTEYEEKQKRLQTFALRAATISVTGDVAAAQALIKEVHEQAQRAKTPPVRKAYDAIAQGLAKVSAPPGKAVAAVPQPAVPQPATPQPVASPPGGPDKTPAPAKPPAAYVRDEVAIVGSWKLVAFQKDGETVKEAEFKNLRWVFTANDLKWTQDEDEDELFFYTLDPSKKPKRLDLKFPENQAEGETVEAVYSLDGDRLTICIGRSDRPTDLTAKAGSKRMLYTLTKEKK